MTRYAYGYSCGMNIILVTSQFLIGFKAHSIGRIMEITVTENLANSHGWGARTQRET